MRFPSILIVICVLFSCSNNKEYIQENVTTDPQHTVTDTLSFIEEYILKSRKGKDSLVYDTTNKYVQYDDRTVLITSYSISNTPNGSGQLIVTTEDGKEIPIPLPNTMTVAAISSLLQNDYVRMDTVGSKFYSWKLSYNRNQKAKRPF